MEQQNGSRGNMRRNRVRELRENRLMTPAQLARMRRSRSHDP
jgi:hypothetical protein